MFPQCGCGNSHLIFYPTVRQQETSLSIPFLFLARLLCASMCNTENNINIVKIQTLPSTMVYFASCPTTPVTHTHVQRYQLHTHIHTEPEDYLNGIHNILLTLYCSFISRRRLTWLLTWAAAVVLKTHRNVTFYITHGNTF